MQNTQEVDFIVKPESLAHFLSDFALISEFNKGACFSCATPPFLARKKTLLMKKACGIPVREDSMVLLMTHELRFLYRAIRFDSTTIQLDLIHALPESPDLIYQLPDEY